MLRVCIPDSTENSTYGVGVGAIPSRTEENSWVSNNVCKECQVGLERLDGSSITLVSKAPDFEVVFRDKSRLTNGGLIFRP